MHIRVASLDEPADARADEPLNVVSSLNEPADGRAGEPRNDETQICASTPHPIPNP